MLVCVPSVVDPSPLSAQGFDEFMNLVMDNAEEVFIKNEITRRPIGVCVCVHMAVYLTELGVQYVLCR